MGFYLGAVQKPLNHHQQKINAIAADAMLQHVASQARAQAAADVTDLKENVSPQGGRGIDQNPAILDLVASNDYQTGDDESERSAFDDLDLSITDKKKKKDAKKKKKDDKKSKKEGKKDKKGEKGDKGNKGKKDKGN